MLAFSFFAALLASVCRGLYEPWPNALPHGPVGRQTGRSAEDPSYQNLPAPKQWQYVDRIQLLSEILAKCLQKTNTGAVSAPAYPKVITHAHYSLRLIFTYSLTLSR